jgi:hypothetical protein
MHTKWRTILRCCHPASAGPFTQKPQVPRHAPPDRQGNLQLNDFWDPLTSPNNFKGSSVSKACAVARKLAMYARVLVTRRENKVIAHQPHGLPWILAGDH